MPTLENHKVRQRCTHEVQGCRDPTNQWGGHGVRKQDHACKLYEGARSRDTNPCGQRRCRQLYLFRIFCRVVARVNRHLDTILRRGSQDKGSERVGPEDHEPGRN